jgi:hypothetical protein
MKMLMVGLIVFGTVCGYVAIDSGRGQDGSAGPPRANVQTKNDLAATVARRAEEVDGITRQLRQTEGEAKKAELVNQLEIAVSHYFDEDLQLREADLAQLEQRVGKLRAQLERRRTSKSEITQLQVKVLVSDADGLGISGASHFYFSKPVPGASAVPSVPAAPPTPGIR